MVEAELLSTMFQEPGSNARKSRWIRSQVSDGTFPCSRMSLLIAAYRLQFLLTTHRLPTLGGYESDPSRGNPARWNVSNNPVTQSLP